MSNGAPPPVPGTPPAAPASKGLSPWAWVAVGCGAMIVIGLVGFLLAGMFVFKKGKEMVREATGSESFQEVMKDLQDNPLKAVAETAIRVNPELDLISTDDQAGTITFRNNKTGEEATLDFEDIDAGGGAEGGVTFKGPEGETRFGASADLSDVPDWVPRYPGATEVQGTMHSTSASGVTGAFTGKTTDDAQTVVDHFKQLFEDGGYEVGAESMTKTGDGAFGAVNGDLGDGRSINVVVIENAGGTSVTVNYNQKKP